MNGFLESLKNGLQSSGVKVADVASGEEIGWRDFLEPLVPDLQGWLAEGIAKSKVELLAKLVTSIFPPAGLVVTAGGVAIRSLREKRVRDERDKEATALFAEAVEKLSGGQCAAGDNYFTKERIEAIYRAGFDPGLSGSGMVSSETDYEGCLDRLVKGFACQPGWDGCTRILVECALQRTFSVVYERSLADPVFVPLLGDRHWYLSDAIKPPPWWWTGFWQRYGDYLVRNPHSPFHSGNGGSLVPSDYQSVTFSGESSEFDGERFAAGEEHGEGRLVCLGADPGMGKTTLVAKMVQIAAGRLANMKSRTVPIPVFFHDRNGSLHCSGPDAPFMDYLARMPLGLVGHQAWTRMEEALRIWWKGPPDRGTLWLLDGFDYLAVDVAAFWIGWLLEPGNAKYWSPKGPVDTECRVVVTGRRWVWDLPGMTGLDEPGICKKHFGQGFDQNSLEEYLGGHYETIQAHFRRGRVSGILRTPLVASKVKAMSERGELEEVDAASMAGVYESILWHTFHANIRGRGLALDVEDCLLGWMRVSLFGLWRDGETISQSFFWKNKDLRQYRRHAADTDEIWAQLWKNREWAGEIPELLQTGLEAELFERTGEDKRGRFAFAHLSFKEFLAARALMKLEDVSREAPLLKGLGIGDRVERLMKIVEFCKNGERTKEGPGIVSLPVWTEVFCMAGGMMEEAEAEQFVQRLIEAGEVWLAGHMIEQGGMPVEDKWRNLVLCLLRHGGGEEDPGVWYAHKTEVFERKMTLHELGVDTLRENKSALPDDAAKVVENAFERLLQEYKREEPNGKEHSSCRKDPLVVSLLDVLCAVEDRCEGAVCRHVPGGFPGLFSRHYSRGYRLTYQRPLATAAAVLGAGCGWNCEATRHWRVLKSQPNAERNGEIPDEEITGLIGREIESSIEQASWRGECSIGDRVSMLECLRGLGVEMARLARWNERDAALNVAWKRADSLSDEIQCADGMPWQDWVTLRCRIEYALGYGERIRQRLRIFEELGTGADEAFLKGEWGATEEMCSKHWRQAFELLRLREEAGGGDIHLLLRGLADTLYHAKIMRCVSNTQCGFWMPPEDECVDWMGGAVNPKGLLAKCMEETIRILRDGRADEELPSEDMRSLLKGLILFAYFLFPFEAELGGEPVRIMRILGEAVELGEILGNTPDNDLMLRAVAHGNRGIAMAYWAETSEDCDKARADLKAAISLLEEQSVRSPGDTDSERKLEIFRDTALRNIGESKNCCGQKMNDFLRKPVCHGNLLLSPQIN